MHNERSQMNPSRLFITSLTAVIVLAITLCGPPMADAQGRAARVAGAYTEVVSATSIPESYTTLVIHPNGTFAVIESTLTGQQTFVGAWSFLDGLIIEGNAVGVQVSAPDPTGINLPQLEVSERSYMIVFNDKSYLAGTVTSTSGALTSFAIERIMAPVQPEPPG